jgi:1,4-dihydroxy-2-naphthoyl-CoA synthase
MAKTAQQMTEKYTRGLADAGKAYTDGVQGVTKNPAEAAIAAAPKYEKNVMDAIREGRYQRGLEGVTLTGWQQAAKAGASKLTQSAQTAGAKYAKYAQEAAPVLAQISQQIQAMPNVTEGDADARMLENVRLMRQLKGVNRGRR